MASEYSNWFPSYGDLPMEIILHIFRFLNHSDVQVAGAVCSRWRDALSDTEFTSKAVVRFAKVCLSDRLEPGSVFLKCDRPYRSFYLEEITFGPVQELMSHIGRTAEEVTFNNVDLGDKQFYAIMRQLPHLRSLTVTNCSPLFMSGSFLDNNDDRMVVDLTFASIKHLSLCYNQYLSDAILLRLTALIQCIESLDLSGCHIAYHNAIQRRFYPNETTTVSPSESILTFKFIMRVLALHRPHLRELNLSYTLIGGPSLIALCELESGGLDLLRLRLGGCRQINCVGMKSFLQTQSNLVLLDLSDTLCVNDSCIEALVNATPLLEEINFAACAAISNEGAAFLGRLKYLRRLDISRCSGISSDGLTRGIAKSRNHTLQELQMSHLKVCDECIKHLSHNLVELRCLNLSHCINGATDESVQSIIQNLRWLRELSLEDCLRITDAALTGINLSKLELRSPPSCSSFGNFHPPPTSSLFERDCLNESMQTMKISLRSKAEEDIVRDASRKKAMFAAYELNQIDERDIEGHNILQLHGLRALNLKGCNKISDVSLIYGLKFIELRRLSLSNCQQISFLGMETLVLNCPSLEELDLSDCYNITDKALQVITSKLKRLRVLHINGCSQLTDHSLDAILVNCKCLQTLSVHRCRLMYTDIEDRLSTMSTLRNLNMDHTTNIDNAEIFRYKKRLDY